MIDRRELLKVLGALATLPPLQIVEGSALKRFEVCANYPPRPDDDPAFLECGLYGVVAEKYERDFFGARFYGPAKDGERQLVAEWPMDNSFFVRELAPGEQWGKGLRAVFPVGAR